MPTNTNAMEYDTYYHKYILKHTYLKSEYGLDFVAEFGSESQAKDRMLRIANRIYNFIYNHKYSHKRYWEYYLAFEEDARPVLEKAMIYQAMYDIESHVQDLQNRIGLNVLNGTKLKLDDMRGERGVALDAIDELRLFKDGILISTAQRYYLPIDTTFDYTTMGY